MHVCWFVLWDPDTVPFTKTVCLYCARAINNVFMPFLAGWADGPRWNSLATHAKSRWHCALGESYICHRTYTWLKYYRAKVQWVPDSTSGFTGRESTACNSKITTRSFLSTPPEVFNCQAQEAAGSGEVLGGFLKYLAFFFSETKKCKLTQ